MARATLVAIAICSAFSATVAAQSLNTTGDIETAAQLKSTVATGTAPLAVTSTTLVPNLNAHRLDGMDASFFAADSDVLALEKGYDRLIVVQAGANATQACIDLRNAVSDIVDNSASRPYTIKLTPGTYDCGTSRVVLKPYVDLEGSGRAITLITGNLSMALSDATVALASSSELRQLTVSNTGGDTFATAISVPSGTVEARVTDVSAVATGTSARSQALFVLGQAQLFRVRAAASGGASDNIGVIIVVGWVTADHLIASAEGSGVFTWAVSVWGTFVARNSEATVAGSGSSGFDAVGTAFGGTATIVNSQLTGGVAGPGFSCFNAYDGNLAALDSSCAPLPP